MVTYKWSILAIEVVPQEDNVSDVVAVVKWRLDGEDGEYTGSSSGVVNLSPYQPGQPFIPYEDLTEDVVLGWTLDALGPTVPVYESIVAGQISDKMRPPVEPRPLPWSPV